MEVAFLALFGSKMQMSKMSSVFHIVKLRCYAQYFTHIVKRHLLALKYGNTLSKSWSAAMFFLTSRCLKTILRNLNTSHSLILERIHFYDMIHAASTFSIFSNFLKKKKKKYLQLSGITISRTKPQRLRSQVAHANRAVRGLTWASVRRTPRCWPILKQLLYSYVCLK